MTSVLLAEDHVMVRQALRRLLETRGIEVVGEATDGRQVADLVAEQHPDVLLLDLTLPGLHGLDVVRQVVKRSPATRVLVLSGEGREDFVVGALRQGAAGYLLKGSDADELVTAIDRVASGQRYVSPELSDHLVHALVEPHDAADVYDTLTDREREVFKLMAEGLSNSRIGEALFISTRTVETHRANILRKLGLRSQTEVVLYAHRRGLITNTGP